MCIEKLKNKIIETASNILLEPECDEKTWRLAIEKSKSEANQATIKAESQDKKPIGQ